jgi:hypothetical protein
MQSSTTHSPQPTVYSLQSSSCRLLPFAFILFLVPLWSPLRAQEAPKPQPTRTWTSVNGNTIDGAFVKEEEGKIFIKRPDGSTIATSREKLSPLDLAWIDGKNAPVSSTKTLSFPMATQLEKNKMEEHKKVRRLIIKSYTVLTNNDRSDKTLAFLERDAQSMYNWKFITSDCYLTKSGKKGKIKTLNFLAQAPVELREAVQMVRDKFTLPLPDPAVVKEISEDGETYWEVQGLPDYVSRVLLLVDPETKNIKRFDLHFPPPAK